MQEYDHGSEEKEDRQAIETQLKALTAEYRSIVESSMKEIVMNRSRLLNSTYDEAMGGGKRLRPIIALLVCEAVSGSFRNAVPIALAYELAHSASLVQDDIIDKSPLRHARPSIQGKYGVANAILISDALIFKMFEVVSAYDRIEISKKKLSRLLAYISASAEKTAEGEFLEVAASSKKDLSEEEYLTIAGLKTGALFAGVAASGAVAGKATTRVEKAMYRFGYHLGIAFQIRDDILDVTGTQEEIGKPVMEDLRNNASNIAIIHALSRADAYSRSVLKSMVLKRVFGMSDVSKFRQLLADLKSIEYCENLATMYRELARNELKGIPDSPARNKLDLLTYLLRFRRD